MKMRSLIIVISTGILALLIMLGILFVKKPMNYNIVLPENISQVEDFVKSQSNYTVIENSDKYLSELSIKNNEEMYAGKINKNSNDVNLISVKFNSEDASKDYIENFSKKRLGPIKISQFEFNLPGYSYITVKSNGIKYYVWRKDNWVVEISGSDTKSVRQVKSDLEKYIK